MSRREARVERGDYPLPPPSKCAKVRPALCRTSKHFKIEHTSKRAIVFEAIEGNVTILLDRYWGARGKNCKENCRFNGSNSFYVKECLKSPLWQFAIFHSCSTTIELLHRFFFDPESPAVGHWYSWYVRNFSCNVLVCYQFHASVNDRLLTMCL